MLSFSDPVRREVMDHIIEVMLLSILVGIWIGSNVSGRSGGTSSKPEEVKQLLMLLDILQGYSDVHSCSSKKRKRRNK